MLAAVAHLRNHYKSTRGGALSVPSSTMPCQRNNRWQPWLQIRRMIYNQIVHSFQGFAEWIISCGFAYNYWQHPAEETLSWHGRKDELIVAGTEDYLFQDGPNQRAPSLCSRPGEEAEPLSTALNEWWHGLNQGNLVSSSAAGLVVIHRKRLASVGTAELCSEWIMVDLLETVRTLRVRNNRTPIVGHDLVKDHWWAAGDLSVDSLDPWIGPRMLVDQEHEID